MNIQEKKKQFEVISNTLKAIGVESCVLYTKDGVITFGNPIDIVTLYLHCDKHFIDDVWPGIMQASGLADLVKE